MINTNPYKVKCLVHRVMWNNEQFCSPPPPQKKYNMLLKMKSVNENKSSWAIVVFIKH